jgi:hypothetical protein
MTTKMPSRTLREFQDLARRHALPPEAAGQMMAVLQNHLDRMRQRRAALLARWADQARSDPEYGRNAFPSALYTARQAVDRFGGDRLKKLLDDTLLGSHPEIIRTFWRVGKATEHLGPTNRQRAPTHADTMRALYPSMYGTKI